MTTIEAGEVERFVAAAKRTPATRAQSMEWRPDGPDTLTWSARLETSPGLSQGSVYCVAKTSLERCWFFKLRLGGAEVRRWDVNDRSCSHSNPRHRPSSFPRKVTYPFHEHVWVEGHDLRCARPLPSLVGLTHEEVWARFCQAYRIECTITYRAPTFGERLSLPV